jgi:Caspase domain
LLNQGFNKIQLSCINSQGVESLRETFYTNFQPIAKQSIPKTYYIGIGVSDYKDTKMNLRYAYKDVVDLDAVFKSTNDSANYRFHVFGNAAATRENILQIKKVLAQSNIEDKVIISISGHGLLDGNNEFYFATHDMDFNNPASKGLSYDSLEDLLDDIPARKKLLLIDACHSGEVDKEVITEIDSSTNVKTYGAKGFIVNPNKKSADLQNSFELMRELFADLSRGNGSIVISAAGGLEYALEDEKYSNGVFTYSIKKGLLEGEADKNANQKITVNELKEFVTKRVMELTKGRQRPTSRKEALEFDWTL